MIELAAIEERGFQPEERQARERARFQAGRLFEFLRSGMDPRLSPRDELYQLEALRDTISRRIGELRNGCIRE